MIFSLTSTAFESNGEISQKYSGEGEDLSPALHWQGVPEHAIIEKNFLEQIWLWWTHAPVRAWVAPLHPEFVCIECRS